MTLINDVLDISRIESGKLEYKPVPVDLRDMINTVLSIAKGYMEKDPGMSYTDAVAKAWESNPELLASYDEEAGV